MIYVAVTSIYVKETQCYHAHVGDARFKRGTVSANIVLPG